MGKIVNIMIIIISGALFSLSSAQEPDEDKLLEEFYKWKVIHFTGPGNGEGRITSVAVEKGKDLITKVYALSIDELPHGPLEMIKYQRYINEFKWSGTSWERTKADVGIGNAMTGTCIDLGLYALREGDDTLRFYYGTIAGAVYEYEYSESEGKWKLANTIANSWGGFDLTQGFGIGSRLKDNNKKYIYINFSEYEWSGNTWREAGKIQISDSPLNQFARISNVIFANWGENENHMYFTYETSDSMNESKYLMSELKWTGNSWQEISKIDVVNKAENWSSRPIAFLADLGRGFNLYSIANFDTYGGTIKECFKDNVSWRVKDLRTGGAGEFGPFGAFAITYGKISSKDPYSIYILSLGGGQDGKIPDKIMECTYINKKWRTTWNVELKAEGVEITRKIQGYCIAELCMADGRNDEYNRLYIVDSFGNVWECSIPPREFRPLVDENGNIIYGPDGKPMYPGKKGGEIKNTRIPPSILGGSK